jgi:hypothetical protein
MVDNNGYPQVICPPLYIGEVWGEHQMCVAFGSRACEEQLTQISLLCRTRGGHKYEKNKEQVTQPEVGTNTKRIKSN